RQAAKILVHAAETRRQRHDRQVGHAVKPMLAEARRELLGLRAEALYSEKGGSTLLRLAAECREQGREDAPPLKGQEVGSKADGAAVRHGGSEAQHRARQQARPALAQPVAARAHRALERRVEPVVEAEHGGGGEDAAPLEGGDRRYGEA